jgi:RNA polymerase sigma-70 factor, ECF subfamily
MMTSRNMEFATRPCLDLAASEAEFMAHLSKIIPSLTSFLTSLSRSRELAEDLTQDALAKAWRSRGSYAPGTNFKAWLFAIARNEFYSHHRRAWRNIYVDPVWMETLPAAPDQQNWAVKLSDMAHALSCLPVVQRDAILLVGAGGFSYEEASVICKVALGTLKSRVFRARESLQKIMDGDRGSPRAARSGYGNAMTDILTQLSQLSPTTEFQATAVASVSLCVRWAV